MEIPNVDLINAYRRVLGQRSSAYHDSVACRIGHGSAICGADNNAWWRRRRAAIVHDLRRLHRQLDIALIDGMRSGMPVCIESNAEVNDTDRYLAGTDGSNYARAADGCDTGVAAVISDTVREVLVDGVGAAVRLHHFDLTRSSGNQGQRSRIQHRQCGHTRHVGPCRVECLYGLHGIATAVGVANRYQRRPLIEVGDDVVSGIYANSRRTDIVQRCQVLCDNVEIARIAIQAHPGLVGEVRRDVQRSALPRLQSRQIRDMQCDEFGRADIDVDLDRCAGRIAVVGLQRHSRRAGIARVRGKDKRLAVGADGGSAIGRAKHTPVDRIAIAVLRDRRQAGRAAQVFVRGDQGAALRPSLRP